MTQDPFVIKARGLPWSATAEEVIDFFSDIQTPRGEDSVHFTTTREGRPSGECFVEVCSLDDIERALAHDNEHMGKRYIEVKEAKQSEMEWVVKRMANSSPEETIVRLRGIPYDCTKQDIANFFGGLEISPYGITITLDQEGRASGDAYVDFATLQDAENAIAKHKEKIGHRYIEIFRSSKADIQYVVTCKHDEFRPPLMSLRPGPYDRPPQQLYGTRARGRGGMNLGPSGFNDTAGRNRKQPISARGGRPGKGVGVTSSKTGHSIHMRGLPFEATTNDIMTFFSPINPVDIRLLFEPNGRAKGECDVDFASHSEAEAAMKKDKMNMGHRYIELFLKSFPDLSNTGWRDDKQMDVGAPPRMDNYREDEYGGGYARNLYKDLSYRAESSGGNFYGNMS